MSAKRFLNIALTLTVIVSIVLLGISVSFAQAKKKHRPPPPKSQEQVPDNDAKNKFCLVDYTPIEEGKQFRYFYKRKFYNFCSQKCLGLFRLDPQRYVDRWNKIEEGEVEMIEPEPPDDDDF